MPVTPTDECVLRAVYDVVATAWEELRHRDVDHKDDRPVVAEFLTTLRTARMLVLLREAAAVLDQLGVPVRVPEP